jgi:hypothetical protein
MMADLMVDFQSYFVDQQLIPPNSMMMDIALVNPDAAVICYEYGGSGSLPQIDGVTRALQFVCRDTNAKVARTKIHLLYKSLMSEDGILSLSATREIAIYLQQPPFRLKVDEKGRVYYCFNTLVTTQID